MHAARVLLATITEISNRISFVADSGDNKSKTITENIKGYLSTIMKKVEESSATPSLDWLCDVSDAVHDLWDLLEDDQHLQKLKSSSGNITSSFLSLCNRSPRDRRKLLVKLQHVADNWTTALENTNTEEEFLTDSDHRETVMVGRSDLRRQVFSYVLLKLEMRGVVNVVPILGMRGMGKTTLVRSIFYDEQVRRNYDMGIWIDCISDKFVLESFVEPILHGPTMNLGPDLAQLISKKRFLMVLDDFEHMNTEQWFKMLQMLRNTASSSNAIGIIFVIAHDIRLGSLFDDPGFLVEKMSEENSWFLFHQTAGQATYSLRSEVKSEMVNKCRGVPLAIVKMARMLEKSHGEITEPGIQHHLEEQLMREMKHIYYDEIPFWHQKQCFAYLSMIFSSTSDEVDSMTLHRLWLAEGFLGPENLNLEYLSEQCFNEFISRSILKVSNFSYPATFSVNSELMLDLSRYVASKNHFFFYTTNGNGNVKEETLRRVALSPDFDISSEIHFLLNKDESERKLRTICAPLPSNNGWPSWIPHEVKLKWSSCDAIFRAFNHLRVLNLRDLGMKVLPVSIGGLKSLRYLNLSHNNMKKLPNSIKKLKHLQTLILSHCHLLRELPNEIGNLVSLRHLVMDGCFHLTHVPSTLKDLTNLQTLPHFMVSTSNNNNTSGLGELANMNNLIGKLEISHLERFKYKEQGHGGSANLKGKHGLAILILQWNHDEEDDNSYGSNHDQISLQDLEPHPNLKQLEIQGYRGTTFSSWFCSLENLLFLRLYNCSKCKCLPPLDQFPHLKKLLLGRLDSLEYITDQDDSHKQFGLGKLEDLIIQDCPNLVSWWIERTHYPKNAMFGTMKLIEVRHCPKLRSMPLFPNITSKLELESSNVKPLLDTVTPHSFSSLLPSLVIKNVERESPLPENMLESFVFLRDLCISEKMLTKAIGFKYLRFLEVLVLTNCERVDLPADEWKGLVSLETLIIQEMTELDSLPEGIKHLTSLKVLQIKTCPRLANLTEGIRHLRSLDKLIIIDCPLLTPRFESGTGDDWPPIDHVHQILTFSIPQAYDE